MVLMHVFPGALLAARNSNLLKQDRGLETLRANTSWRERLNLTDITKWFLASPTQQLEHGAGSMETPGPLAKTLIDPRLPPGPPGLTHILPLSATLMPLSFMLHTVLPCGNLDDLLSMQKS